MSYDPQKNRRKRDGCKPSLPTTIFIDCLALHSSDNYLIQSSGGLSAKANQLAQTILIFADNTGFGWRSIFSVCCRYQHPERSKCLQKLFSLILKFSGLNIYHPVFFFIIN